MKTQKTKNEIVLDLLERKDWIVNEKMDCLREYQEWVINGPYKGTSVVAAYRILEKITDTFSLRKKWWGKLIYITLSIFFVYIILFLLYKMLMSFHNPSKIPHFNNQIYRTDLKIKEILAKLEEKKEE
jgi:hypothetical protein